MITDEAWPYGWCKKCCDNKETCHHGNQPHECDACFAESDAAYDRGRLTITFIDPEQ